MSGLGGNPTMSRTIPEPDTRWLRLAITPIFPWFSEMIVTFRVPGDITAFSTGGVAHGVAAA